MDIVRVLMTITQKGSLDGVTVLDFDEGVEYDLNSDLAEVFVDELKVATIVEEDDDPERVITDGAGDETPDE